jgi:hypothetical protein
MEIAVELHRPSVELRAYCTVRTYRTVPYVWFGVTFFSKNMCKPLIDRSKVTFLPDQGYHATKHVVSRGVVTLDDREETF